ncbi:hypothetical protein CKO24_06140 [Rhodothalassium salexigens DSM 2132]|nr:hypothetical protein [Rhodothalassium salexigens DSM 2132]
MRCPGPRRGRCRSGLGRGPGRAPRPRPVPAAVPARFRCPVAPAQPGRPARTTGRPGARFASSREPVVRQGLFDFLRRSGDVPRVEEQRRADEGDERRHRQIEPGSVHRRLLWLILPRL